MSKRTLTGYFAKDLTTDELDVETNYPMSLSETQLPQNLLIEGWAYVKCTITIEEIKDEGTN